MCHGSHMSCIIPGVMSLPRRTRTWPYHLTCLAAYLALAAAMFATVLRTPATSYAGSIPDAMQSMWFLSWTAHAVAQHHSLFFTDALNAPHGANLMWNTPMVLLGVIATPLTLTLGPVVTYNALIVAAFAGSAWMAYLVIARWCGSLPSAWMGGLLFAFGPYMTAQSLGHLDLVVMAYPSAALLLLDEIVVRRRRRWWWCGVLLGVATAAQLLVMEETVVCVAVGAAVLAVALRLVNPASLTADWRYAGKALGTALVTFVVLAAVPLWQQLAGPQVPPGFEEVANPTSSDLLGFVVPTANQALAPAGAEAAAAHFVAQSTGQDAYVGIPMLVLCGLLVWAFRRHRATRILAVLVAAFAVLSLGPSLNVGGRILPVPLPGALLGHVPLVNNVVPLRWMAFADLGLAAMVAYGMTHRLALDRPKRIAIPVLTLLVVASWFPALPRPALSPPTPASLPPAVAHMIPPGGTVLFAPLPSLSSTDAMWYQLRDSFRFRLVAGYVYRIGASIPLESVLSDGSSSTIDAAEHELAAAGQREELVAAYRAIGVTTIVVPPGPGAAAYDGLLTRLCGDQPSMVDGFAIWSLPPNATGGTPCPG